MRVFLVAGLVMSLALSAAMARSAGSHWDVQTGLWTEDSNWTAGVPTSSSTAFIDNGGTALLPTAISGSYNILSVGSVAGGDKVVVSGGALSGTVTNIGASAGTTGNAVISGGTWDNTSLYVGASGTGDLLVSGGTLSVTGASGVIDIGNGAGSVGTVTVTGGAWNNDANLGFGVGASGKGTLTISGGTVTNTSNTTSYIGINDGGDGTVTVKGSGRWVNEGPTGLLVGTYSGSEGTLNVSENGYVSAYNSILGSAQGSHGTANISGGTWSNYQVNVGDQGIGDLTITGGQVSDTNGFLGYGATGVGTATVSGGSWEHSEELFVGMDGKGTLTISGGDVKDAFASVGEHAGSIGSVVVNSGSWITSGGLPVTGGVPTMVIGNSGTGTSEINGGLVKDGIGVLGYQASSSGTVTVSGGRWENTATVPSGSAVPDVSILVGGAGAGELNLVGDGVVQSLGVVGLAKDQGSSGTLKIGNGTTAGTLLAPMVVGGAGDAKLIFDHNHASYSFAPTIAGSVNVQQNGVGKTVFAQSQTYTGSTIVNNGQLATQSLASSTVKVNGGYFSPGDVGHATSITVQGLNLNGGRLLFDLGASGTSDQIISSNPVTLTSPSSFFFNNAGFTPGTYTLISGVDNGFDLNLLGYGSNISGLSGEFSIVGSDLLFTGAIVATPGQLDNQAGTSETALFEVIFGSETGPSGASNAVMSLSFAPNGTLTLNGPLSITQGTFNVASGTGVILGNYPVSTPGDFQKIGQGLLNLLANMFVGGNAYINEGTLSVNGTLQAQNVLVSLGAWLKGSGFILGNLFNSGVVAPGNSPGTLTVNGNFTQTSGGSLQVEVASSTVFDRLIVSGNAQLAGQLQVLSFGGYKFQYGQQFAFLQAGSISGKFDSIVTSSPETFRARFLTSGGTGSILIAPTSYTLVAQNQNQTNVAKALDSFIPAGGDKEVVSTALDFLTADQYPTAFEQIMPGFYESLGDITIEQAISQNQFLAQRMSAVKLGARGFSAVGMTASLAYDKNGKSVMDAKDAKDGKDILAPTPDNKWGVWVQGNGVFAQVTNVSNLPNYNYQSGGFMTGADYKWSENLTTGAYIGYQGLYSKYNGGGLMTINSALFGGYATYQAGGFYADTIIGGGYNGYLARRPIKFGSIDRVAHSQPNGGQFTTYLDAGYDWKVKGFTFGPLLSGQYTYAGVAPFTETDANSLNLRVDQQNLNSLRMNVGGRVAYTWNVNEKIAIIPEGRLFWQHEFLENSQNIGASLDGGSGASFDYSTSAPDRDSVWAGAGVSAQFGDTWNANFYYNANFGREDFVSHMISGGVGFKF
ncbi:MAG: hypothetical protein BGO12_15805 [Verrucomicrobia bacterium 61-8]|nr:MAG: hypothetical protein BGO12_15805 [Verrucomicrobia bacterium 61-8]